MKKRNFIFAILLALISFVGVKSHSQIFASAETAEVKNNIYTITQAETGTSYSISGGHISGSSYNVIENATSLTTAIAKISEDLEQGTTAQLNFDNISLLENLTINLQKIIIKGTINLNTYSIYLNASEKNASAELNNLTITSSSNQSYITLNGQKTELKVTAPKFSTTSSEKPEYAINCQTKFHSLIFTGELQYDSTFLYNHESGVSSSFSSFSLGTSIEKIKIIVPFYEDGKTIFTTSESSNLFELVPLSQNYTCQIFSSGTNKNASIRFNINFDSNGGSFDTDTTTQTTSRYAESLAFPTPTKPHSTFVGYIGKVKIGTETYYFDKTKLAEFLTSSDTSKLSTTYFTPEETSVFNSCTYSSSNPPQEYSAIRLMLDQGEIPEFVAVWKDTVYEISFVTNNDETIEPIIGTQGSTISTFPANPTKTGYTFDGWYTSSSFTDDTLKTSTDFNAMPGENITLYAKWTKNSYTLTIFPNNNGLAITDSIPFETNLSEILAQYANSLEFTGHKFVKWCSDSSLETEFSAETMPAAELSVYAKWEKESFTITIYKNFLASEELLLEPTTRIFNNSITDYKTLIEEALKSSEFEGYQFRGWFKDKKGEQAYTIPDNVPAENLTLYAKWSVKEYTLEIYYFNNQTTPSSTHNYNFGETITLSQTLNISGYIFNGWYLDSNQTITFNYTKMPSQNLKAYAKMLEKGTISLNLTSQSYTIDNNNGFDLDTNLSGFRIEYLVGNNWTTDTPTQKGSYDVKISRSEDSNYKAFSKVIEKGLTVTANEIDLKIATLILYCIAGFEVLFAIILLFLHKQRKTYLSFVITLPFGIVSNSQFLSFCIALTLAIFGFVLLIIQITKLRKVNAEIAKINIDNEPNIPRDFSENESVSKNVEILLRERGFVSANYHEPEEEDEELAEAIKANEKILSTKPNKDTKENQTDEFDSLEDIKFDDKD